MSKDETWGSNGYNPDFVERNGAFILSMIGLCGAAASAMLVYMLKSRCRYIKCCGVECERDVLNLERSHNLTLNNQAQFDGRITRLPREFERRNVIESSNTQ